MQRASTHGVCAARLLLCGWWCEPLVAGHGTRLGAPGSLPHSRAAHERTRVVTFPGLLFFINAVFFLRLTVTFVSLSLTKKSSPSRTWEVSLHP